MSQLSDTIASLKNVHSGTFAGKYVNTIQADEIPFVRVKKRQKSSRPDSSATTPGKGLRTDLSTPTANPHRQDSLLSHVNTDRQDLVTNDISTVNDPAFGPPVGYASLAPIRTASTPPFKQSTVAPLPVAVAPTTWVGKATGNNTVLAPSQTINLGAATAVPRMGIGPIVSTLRLSPILQIFRQDAASTGSAGSVVPGPHQSGAVIATTPTTSDAGITNVSGIGGFSIGFIIFILIAAYLIWKYAKGGV